MTLDEVIGFADTFERQSKELVSSRAKWASSQPGGGAGPSKWNTPGKKVENTTSTNTQGRPTVKALPGPQPIKAIPPMEDKRVQCFKCKGYGHYARECPNQRVMVIGQDGSVYSEEDDEGELGGTKEVSPDTDIAFSSGEDEDAPLRALVVLRTLNMQLNLEEHKEQRCNIFHMKCKVKSKTCLVIIDGGSCTNVVCDRLVAKLGLKVLKHPNPYKLQWLGDSREFKVKAQCKVPLKIGEVEEEILCDIIPMTTCHV